MATHEGPADPRQYVRISIDLPTNPKLASLNNPSAAWAYVVSVTNCGASSSDGHFAMALVLRIAGVSKKAGQQLIDQGLWHVAGHDCPRCPQPEAKHAYLHDFLLHNRSAADVQKLTEKRRASGKAGAAARWGNTKAGTSKPMANGMASAMANGQQVPWQMDGKPMAEERREEQEPIPPTAEHAPASPPVPTVPPSRDLAIVRPEPRTTDQIVGWWIENCRARPPGAIIGQLSKQIKKLIDEGIDPAYIRQGIAEWVTKDAHPSLLPSLVNSAMNRQPARPKPIRSTTDERVQGWLDLGMPEQGAIA